MTLRRVNVLTYRGTEDIGRIRDKGQDKEARPFIASSIMTHLLEEGSMSHVHSIKSADGSDYLLIHASGLSFERSCQSWK